MSPRKIVCLIRRHQWEPKTNTFGSGDLSGRPDEEN
jgi:hypothetical protein